MSNEGSVQSGEKYETEQVIEPASGLVLTSLNAAPSRCGSVFFGLRAQHIYRSEIVRYRLIGERVLVAAQKVIADGSLFIHVSDLSDDRIPHHGVHYWAE